MNHILVSATTAIVGTSAVLAVFLSKITATVSHQLMMPPCPTSSKFSLFYCIYSHALASSQFASTCVFTYIETSTQFIDIKTTCCQGCCYPCLINRSPICCYLHQRKTTYYSLKGWIISFHSEHMSININTTLFLLPQG